MGKNRDSWLLYADLPTVLADQKHLFADVRQVSTVVCGPDWNLCGLCPGFCFEDLLFHGKEDRLSFM
ncbi:hypothetical protein [Salimicrobium halophilum]|uniref:hypothetical protein n=1 Tax=Salimicrobium halophilum TaxID=86666 RepID=UPI00115FC3D1|nr:hypothetical protein [Salimicrobium halophilum]